MKPSEFFECQPKDILIMKKGFDEKRDYDLGLYRQILSCLRVGAYTTYAVAPKSKGQKNMAIEKFMPIPMLDDYKVKNVEMMSRENFKELDKNYKKIFKDGE